MPPYPARGEFIQEYFENIHPMLPVLDGADFGPFDLESEAQIQDRDQFSWFTFQALLAAASPVCILCRLF